MKKIQSEEGKMNKIAELFQIESHKRENKTIKITENKG